MNELLVTITKSIGGDTYMYGGGSDGYQDDQIFNEFCVKLKHQEIERPHYKQFGREEFIPSLSIIDAMMNIGLNGVKSILKI